ncbi:MAG: iron-sulfur cluster assembly accessory protein [Alphaproteobacteria bacterium]|nr:iron-sulfur cluster assembly accessory protein [Alphaproteobacteria bacterium]
MALPRAITITDAAAARVKALLATQGEPALGLRVSVATRGCSGLSYRLDVAKHKAPLDEIVEDKGVTILIDAKACLFLLGSEMDYVDDKLQSGFVFHNPNAKGTCGCGESFHV